MANPRVEELRKKLEREPGSRLFAQLAEELRKAGELDEAIRVARDGLQRQPAYPSARMTLGRALLDKRDLDAARVEFEAVLKGAPDNILASRYLAECLEGLDDLEGARARYQATLQLAPGDRQVQARLEEVELKLRRRRVGSSGPAATRAVLADDERPIPVLEVDEPMILESAHEARGIETGEPISPGPKLQQPAPASVGALEESFEVERAREAPEPGGSSEAYAPASEVLFEEDAATIPPGMPLRAPADEAERTLADEASPVAQEPEPLVEAELAELQQGTPVEPLVEAAQPEAAAAAGDVPLPADGLPAPTLSSSTLAELYFNQGFLEKAVEVYRQLLEREPSNERARARLTELEALERHLQAAAAPGPPSPAPPGAPAPAAGEADVRRRRREAIQRTIARLEGLLAAVRRG